MSNNTENTEKETVTDTTVAETQSTEVAQGSTSVSTSTDGETNNTQPVEDAQQSVAESPVSETVVADTPAAA